MSPSGRERALPTATPSSGPPRAGTATTPAPRPAARRQAPEAAVAEARTALADFERFPAARHADAAGALLRALGTMDAFTRVAAGVDAPAAPFGENGMTGP